MGKGKTTEQVKVMNKARVLEMRRGRIKKARQQGIRYSEYMRKSHQKRFEKMQQREPQLYRHLRTAKPVAGRRPAFQPTIKPTPRSPVAYGTSHVGRATRKHFIVPRTSPRQITWFNSRDEQRDYVKKMLKGLY